MNASTRQGLRAGGTTLLLLGLSSGSCDKTAPPAPVWPAGTVLALNGVPIAGAEVDEIASTFALLEPQDSLLQLRRLALTRLMFPRIAAAGIDPARRAEMRTKAEEWRAQAVSGSMPKGPLAGPIEREGSGAFVELELVLWKAALDTEVGHWTPVLENVGGFQFLEVKKREEGPLPSLTRFTIGIFDFPYVDTSTRGQAVETALDHANLIIVDESWREAVPESWLYRLHARKP
jgi:hypothetical protein